MLDGGTEDGALATSSRLVGHALNELPHATFLVFDTDLRFILVRGAAVQENGMDPDQFEGALGVDCLPPERWALYEPMYRAALAGVDSERQVVSPDGVREYLLRTRPVVDDDGTIIGGVLVATDISDVKSAQRRALESERRFSLAMRSAPIGMAVVSLDRTLLEVNHALCHMLDAEPRELVGQSLMCVLHPDDDARDLAVRSIVLAGDEDAVTTEKRLRTLHGGEIWVQHSVALLRDENDEPLHYVSQFVDITEARYARLQLERLAARDQLTQLPNRLSLERQTGEWFKDASGTAGVLFLDLDGFKFVNDTLGHAAGDQVLTITAHRLSHRLRPGDLIARYGGDEFIVAIRSTDTDSVRTIADHLHQAMSAPIDLDGGDVTVGLSIGAAIALPGEDLDAVLRRADQALYGAKEAGGRCTVFDF